MKGGAQGRDRTADTAIFSRMLYQLSYLGIWWQEACVPPLGGGSIEADPDPVQTWPVNF